MFNSYRRYLLSSVAFAPPGDSPNGGGGDPPENDDTLTLEDDAPPEGDEAPAEGDAEGEEGDDEPEVAGTDEDDAGDEPPSRGNRAIGPLRAERRRLADELAVVTRERDELRRGSSTQQQQPQETAQARADRLALMSSAEQTTYLVNEALERHTAQQNMVNAQMLDQADRMGFDAETSTNPLFKKLAPDVERRLADLRGRGQNLPRKVVLTYLLGEKLLAQQGQKRPGAAARREREQVQPRRPAGDVQADRQNRRGGNDIAAMERRLENTQI